MNKLKLFLFSLCLTIALSGSEKAFATASTGKCGTKQCYKIGSSTAKSKGLYINCYSTTIGRGDQQICAHYFSGSTKATCVMIESTINDTNPLSKIVFVRKT